MTCAKSSVLQDLIEMPGFNMSTQQDRGEWSMRDVSQGAVSWDALQKAVCVDHGAMNAVNPDCTIWRCLACGRAAYRTRLPELVAVRHPDRGKWHRVWGDVTPGLDTSSMTERMSVERVDPIELCQACWPRPDGSDVA